MLYKCVRVDTLREVEAAVMGLSRDGWEPLGGVCVTQEDEVDGAIGHVRRRHYHQAMTKAESSAKGADDGR